MKGLIQSENQTTFPSKFQPSSHRKTLAMFSLRIETNHLLSISTSQQFNSTNFTNPNPKIQESRGIVHLYRNITKHSLIQNPNSQESCLLFVVAVPSHISSDDFLLFCGSYIEHVSEILFIRNDGMEDRYSVLIRLVAQNRANDFYRNFNGRRFLSTEAEVCHILYTVSVEFTELAEIAGTAPTGFTELPTCPVCLERLDQDTSGILTTLCDHSFKCPCISKWTDSSCLVCRFCQQQAEKPTCSICGMLRKLWICVICGFVGCGRYKRGHALQHWRDTQHCYSLDLETQKVWDYVGDTYVHRLNHAKTDGKLAEMNSYCRSFDGDCRDPECSEESGISGIVLSNKIEAIVDEYNHLLASELENHRQVVWPPTSFPKLLVGSGKKRPFHRNLKLMERPTLPASSPPKSVKSPDPSLVSRKTAARPLQKGKEVLSEFRPGPFDYLDGRGETHVVYENDSAIDDPCVARAVNEGIVLDADARAVKSQTLLVTCSKINTAMSLLNASFQEVRLVAEVGARAEIDLKHLNEKLEQAKNVAVVAECKFKDKEAENVVLKEMLEQVRGDLAAAKSSAVHWERTCHENGAAWKAYCDNLEKVLGGSPEGEETRGGAE